MSNLDPTGPDSPRPELVLMPPAERKRLSVELEELAKSFQDRPATLSEIIGVIHGRSYYLLIVLLTLPFLTPIPLIGLSTPFGLVVALVALRLALGQRPWIPNRLRETRLPSGFITRLLKAARWIVRKLEFFLRPRLLFMHESVLVQRAVAAMIAGAGLLLLLPVPVPFSNTVPAIAALLLAAGALERDGLFSLMGTLMFLVAVAYFSALSYGGASAVNRIWHGVW